MADNDEFVGGTGDIKEWGSVLPCSGCHASVLVPKGFVGLLERLCDGCRKVLRLPLGPEWQSVFEDEVVASKRLWLSPDLGSGVIRRRAVPIPPSAETPVTPEMIAAADAIGFCMSEESYAALYRAMAALAPVELVSEGERQAVRQRDEALAGREYWATSWRRERSEGVALRSELTASQAHIERLLDANCALGATNERLRDEIASLTVEKVDRLSLAQRFRLIDIAHETSNHDVRVAALRLLKADETPVSASAA